MPSAFPVKDPSLLLILSGPAGCGKTTMAERMIATDPTVQRAITCTTRNPRPGEKHGVDYYFLSEEEFDQEIARNGFLEYAGVHGKRYGTLKTEVTRRLAQSVTVILNIDVQGAETLRKRAGTDESLRKKMISIFVLPTSLDLLRERLIARGSENAEAIAGRLTTAKTEILEWRKYDYCIRSGSKDEEFHQFQSILTAERRKVSRLLEPEI